MYYAKKLWAAGSGGEVDLNFVPFVAPESFNDPSKYADFGCTVNLHEKFRIYKMTWAGADIAVEFSDAIASVKLPRNTTIEVFETVLGNETSVLYTTAATEETHRFTSGSTKRYMIRRITTTSTFNFPIGSVWAYCCGLKILGSTPYTAYLKYIFLYENTLINLYSFRDTTIEGVLTINDIITDISITTFKGCTNLTKVLIGDSVTTIYGDDTFGSFQGCQGLLEVDLGTGLTAIGTDTFLDCMSLASIICRAYNPPTFTKSTPFNGIPETTKFYVPNERVDVYKAAAGWVEFASRIYSINDL